MNDELRARFDQIARGVPTALVLVSIHDERVLSANAAARELGIAPGAPLWSALDDDDGARAFVRSCIAAPSEAQGSLHRGSARLAATGWRLAPDEPAVVLHLAPHHDRARSDAERALLIEAAAAADRRKDEFLAMLGHELRNPLAPIQTAVELMRAREPDRFRREREVIERQARLLAMLVDDILDVTRITAGKFELRVAPGRLDETVQRAIDRIAPALERRHHELDVSIGEPLAIEADHDRLAQVIANLLDNACKYTDPGGHISLQIARGDGRGIEVRVRDNGRGIAPELLPRVFDAFVQDERSGARTPGGLGLGLAIAKGIVTLHGGEIVVQSEGPGKGTEAIVRLPDANAERSDELPAIDAAAAADTPVARARGKTVLVVDDNLDAASLIAEGLDELGYHAVVAGDGPSALRLVRLAVPDVALIDLGMPVMDGFELSQQLRALAPLSRMRHIAVTGYGGAKDHEATRSAGFDAHLVKPVRLEQVAATIAELVAASGDDESPA